MFLTQIKASEKTEIASTKISIEAATRERGWVG